MNRPDASAAGAADAIEFRNGLLARFGLPPDASPQEIEVARDKLVAFLDAVPPSLRSWAAGELAVAHQTYALLRVTAGPAGDGTFDASDDTDDAAGQVPGFTGPAAVSAPADLDDLDEDDLDALHEPAAGTDRKPAGATAVAPTAAVKGQPGRVTASRRRPPGRPRAGNAPDPGRQARQNRRIQAFLVVALLAAIGFGVWSYGQRDSVPGITGQPTASPSATVNTAKVGELMQKLQTNPKDVDTLRQLGDTYLEGQDFKSAAEWEKKIIAIDAKNTTALVALGICNYNVGDIDGAVQQFKAAIAVNPKLIDAHFNLGFVYISQNKNDLAKAEWEQVVKIDPNSNEAKTVSTHLDSLDKTPAPSGSGQPTATPTASPSR